MQPTCIDGLGCHFEREPPYRLVFLVGDCGARDFVGDGVSDAVTIFLRHSSLSSSRSDGGALFRKMGAVRSLYGSCLQGMPLASTGSIQTLGTILREPIVPSSASQVWFRHQLV